MLTSKQRSQLRSAANTLDTIIHIGKGGVSENVGKQTDGALTAREIVKGKVLENSLLSAREAADALAASVSAEVVQVIGTKFVLYRENKKLPKEKKIILVK
ncbi:MAG: YhbY family RNA-binding protein [Oscillospiraceae bacterium]|jgi:RNA-binding protein|nr:YhbY family RNA-binding protein [Oscillospiraceae bacterium]